MRIIVEAEPGEAGREIAESVRRKIAMTLGPDVQIKVGTRALQKAA